MVTVRLFAMSYRYAYSPTLAIRGPLPGFYHDPLVGGSGPNGFTEGQLPGSEPYFGTAD